MLANCGRWYTFLPPQWSTIPPPLTPGLNLLAAIVIYWNTAHLGEAVRQRKHADLTVELELLAHISPLGWGHILLTGEYRWPKRR